MCLGEGREVDVCTLKWEFAKMTQFSVIIFDTSFFKLSIYLVQGKVGCIILVENT